MANLLGMRIENVICNLSPTSVAGWLMSFADMMLPMASHKSSQGRPPVPADREHVDRLSGARAARLLALGAHAGASRHAQPGLLAGPDHADDTLSCA